MKCSTNLISDVIFFPCKTYRYVPEPEIATFAPGEGSETSHAPPPVLYSIGKRQNFDMKVLYLYFCLHCVPAMQALMSENDFD
jgi:hypothetical protein